MRKLLPIFVILWGLSYAARAQPMLVQLSLKDPGAQEELSLEARYPAGGFQTGGRLKMMFLSGSVDSIQHLQGRAKSTLSFEHKGESLWVNLPQNLHPQSQVNIHYKLPVKKLEASPYFKKVKNGWVINALNMSDEGDFGLPGFFYPVLDNRPHHLQMNLTLPAGLNFSLNGELQYRVKHGDKISYFTKTEEPMSPAEFYLVIGDFEEEDPEDILEEYEIQTLSPEELAVRKTRERLQPALDFFSDQTGYLFLDESLQKLPEMAEDEEGDFFLKRSDFANNPPAEEQWHMVKAAAEMAAEGDVRLASALHYNYYVHERGVAWKRQLLENRWVNYEEQGDFFWEQYLEMLLNQAGVKRRLADTTLLSARSGRAENRDQAYLSVVREVYRLRQPLKISLRYRYSQADSALYLYLNQPDTTLQSSIPLQGSIIRNEESTVLETLRYAYLRTHDTLKIAMAGGPKSARFRVDESLPVQLKEHRPQTYLLYELTQSEKPELQQRALEELLETSSANLFTTVMGIALDSENTDLQLKALEKADQLDAEGKRKLRETINNLAQSAAHSELRTKAQSLVERLYR